MKSLLIDKLETIRPGNVYLQGTLAEDVAYPDSFITFWTTSTGDNGHYDDQVRAIDWIFYVYFYTNDPAEITTVPGQIETALKAAGFIPQGKGYDISSDVITHTGHVQEFIYKEILTT